MKEKIILTDCDGVLFNWNDGFDKFAKIKGYRQIPDTDHFYSLTDRYGITFDQAMDMVAEYNESSFISDLKPFADSVEFVGRLSELGFRFIVVTAISNKPSAKIYRTENLHNVFGEVFDDIICIQMDTSKYSTLKRWAGSDLFWVEDHMRQAEAGYENGLNPILINHPYNIHFKTDLFPRVSYETPWEEIYKIVKEEYQI